MEESIINLLEEKYNKSFKDKINTNENIEEYFENLGEDDLKRVLLIYTAIKDNSDLFGEFLNTNKSVAELREYILNNYVDIYENILKYLMVDLKKELKKIVNNYSSGLSLIDLSEERDLLPVFYLLREYGFIKVYIKEEKELMDVFFPDEIYKIVKSSIKNKKIISESKYIEEIISNIKIILNVYGILSLNKLVEIYSKLYGDIEVEYLTSIIFVRYLIVNDMSIYERQEVSLVALPIFENEDQAFTYYNSLDKNEEYKEFNKKELKDYYNMNFYANLNQTYKLSEFMIKELYMNFINITEFVLTIGYHYISLYQKEPKSANVQLRKWIDESFEGLVSLEKAYLIKYLQDIAKQFPAYYLKGYAPNEKKK